MNVSTPAAVASINELLLMDTTSPGCRSMPSNVSAPPCASAPYVAMNVLPPLVSLSTSRNPVSASSRSGPICVMSCS